MQRSTQSRGRESNGRRKGSKLPRVDIASIRREQVVDAAARIIALRGIQSLSLSEIEAETGMSRGQLTYYFPTKEDILLAVFDRTVQHLRQQMAHAGHELGSQHGDGWELIEALLSKLLLKPLPADFTQLQYSFLAQTGFRNDFRERLASLYEQWRSHMAESLSESAAERRIDPRLFASFVQALLHGLVMQRQADPHAFDCKAMFCLCMDSLSILMGRPTSNGRKSRRSNGRHAAGGRRHV
jgi:AcrR family transcriptional regulator